MTHAIGEYRLKKLKREENILIGLMYLIFFGGAIGMAIYDTVVYFTRHDPTILTTLIK